MAFKRKPKKQAEQEDWMTTYADAITLLLCFFVIILNVAEPKPSAYEALREAFMQEFSTEKPGTPFSDIYDRFESIVDVNQLEEDVSVEETDRGVMLEFNSASIFAPGSADILPRAEPTLDDIIQQVVSFEYDGFGIEVEGHTDDEPINTLQFPSNWELSTARASAVVRYFIAKSVDKQRLTASGYADAFPKMPNRDSYGDPIPENQEINRRIVIHLVRE